MNNENNKCAHGVCRCPRTRDSEYCSSHCEAAAQQDMTEISCDCGCPTCT